MSAPYLGDFVEDETVHFLWSTNGADGASITRATNGTVSVYKDNGTTQSTAGVTDTEDFDSLTGIHACTINLAADAFYVTGANYTVVLSGATIDGQSVNAVLAHFSIENRTSASSGLTANDIADALLVRDIDQVEGSPGPPFHSLYTAIAKAVCRTRNNAGTLEIYDTAGGVHAEQTIIVDAAAQPIKEITGAVAP